MGGGDGHACSCREEPRVDERLCESERLLPILA